MDSAAVTRAAQRILARSDRARTGPVVRGVRCMVFGGARSGNGYRYVNVGGRIVGAHRVVFAHRHGPIPDGRVVMHACDVAACMEDRHHILGTHAQNVADMVAKDRHNRGERNGHARLSADDVRSIRQRRIAGERGVDLAAEFGVCASTVKAIVARARWASVA